MRQDFICLKVMEAMRAKGITTDDIAKVLGRAKGYTRNILLDRRRASEEDWRIICTAVGVDLDEIIQAEMDGRLPGLCPVSVAWAALRSATPYPTLEILEEAPTVAADAATPPPEEEAFGGCSSSSAPLPPAPCCGKGSDPKASLPEGGGCERSEQTVGVPHEDAIDAFPLFFTPGELALLIAGLRLTLTLQDAMGVYPERPDNMLDIRHIHHLTGLMLRLNETLEGGDEHA